jgi:hypothetical protein
MPRFVVPLDANWHRRVTDVRRQVGVDDWPRANGDALLVAAHLLAGLASLTWALAAWLVDLSRWISRELGSDWFRRAPHSPFGQ